jgi:hypothetical protein
MKTVLLLLALAAAPLEIWAEEVKVLSGTITERWLAATTRGPLQLARLETADGRRFMLDLGAPGGEGTIQKGDKVVLTARAGELDGKPVLVVRAITEQIPAR